ncbi:NAD(P)-dependent oxidoreductase [Pigmentiphaga soli]
MTTSESPPVALLAPMPPLLTKRLQESGFRVINAFEAAPEALLEVRAAVTRGSLDTGHAVFSRFPRLGLLCCWGVGYDGVDLAAARERGIQVSNSPGINAASVADLAIGLMISIMRALPVAERYLRAGQWQDAGVRLPAARGLTGGRVGIFGYGQVGRRVAARARALDMTIGCYTRRPPADDDVQAFPDLVSLAQWADVLVVAASADASTFHAVDARVLQALGPEGYLVNVSRGSVVDEAALCRVLDARQLAGVGSDVFEQEPQVSDALLKFPNAVLTPHVGGSTQSAQAALVETVVSNVTRFFSEGRPLYPVATGA